MWPNNNSYKATVIVVLNFKKADFKDSYFLTFICIFSSVYLLYTKVGIFTDAFAYVVVNLMFLDLYNIEWNISNKISLSLHLENRESGVYKVPYNLIFFPTLIF